MLFASFGDGLLNMLLLIAISGILYRKWFPKNEPGELAKRGFIEWIKGRILK